MPFRLFFYDHNAYHRRFRDTWSQREKGATRPFTFQPKALEMFENQYKSELLIRSHRGGRGFESLRVHQIKKTPVGVFFYLADLGERKLFADFTAAALIERERQP